MTSWTLRARWVFPVSAPPIPDGTVTIDGECIRAVEPAGYRSVDLDLGNVAILPGLVNAHTHLDLTGMRGLAPPSPDFTGWLRQVIAHRRARTPEQVQADIRSGLAESIRAGVTLLGDISGDGSSWDVLRDAPLRAVVFRELLGLTQERADQSLALAREWLDQLKPSATCHPGLSPHAPYSVRATLFTQVAELARQRQLPVSTHIAESVQELMLMAGRHGEFVDFLSEMGACDLEGLVESWEWILQTFMGLPNTLMIHANYLGLGAVEDSMRRMLYVVCPRTRAAFLRWALGKLPLSPSEFRVVLGTDSLASNPDLDLLTEARFVHQHEADLPGETLLRMITLSGAEALGWADETGSLTPGKSADLVVLPLPTENPPDPHGLLFASTLPVRAVLFRGRWVHDADGQLSRCEAASGEETT